MNADFSALNSRGGASGNKLKMTLGLPVYVALLWLTRRLDVLVANGPNGF